VSVTPDAAPAPEVTPTIQPTPAPEPTAAPDLVQQAEQVLTDATQKVEALADSVDANPQVREFSAGILSPIYKLAESFESSEFYWAAFALMVTGVVSYLLQLVLGKLVVLSKLGFSITEIVSDLVGLVISVIGLVLTTQAATQNSSFTESAASVLSASAVGVVLGIVLYAWGQAQEVAANKAKKDKQA
jgi:hypothetical protein